MRFALMIELKQGLTYDEQLAIVRRAHAAGFESFFRSDHYAGFPGDGEGPTTDAWAVLAGLARETEGISLGTLVSPVTFRHPGNFVKLVTTVDHMSGGRLEIGVGAGWNDDDHGPLGLAFQDETLGPPGRDRSTLVNSAMVTTLIGADQADFARRAEQLMTAFGIESATRAEWLAGRRPRLIMGIPDEARAMVRRCADAGVARLMLQDFLPLDLEMIDLLGAEPIGRV